MTKTETPAPAPAISSVQEFSTTTRYHIEGAPIVQIDGKSYRADFVDVDKLNRNYAHRGPRIGVHMVRLTKGGRPFKDNAQSMWLWSIDGRHDELVGDVIALVAAPRSTTWMTNPDELQAGDQLDSINGVALGTEGVLIEQVRADSRVDYPGGAIVTAWFGPRMVELALDCNDDVVFRRGA